MKIVKCKLKIWANPIHQVFVDLTVCQCKQKNAIQNVIAAECAHTVNMGPIIKQCRNRFKGPLIYLDVVCSCLCLCLWGLFPSGWLQYCIYGSPLRWQWRSPGCAQRMQGVSSWAELPGALWKWAAVSQRRCHTDLKNREEVQSQHKGRQFGIMSNISCLCRQMKCWTQKTDTIDHSGAFRGCASEIDD